MISDSPDVTARILLEVDNASCAEIELLYPYTGKKSESTVLKKQPEPFKYALQRQLTQNKAYNNTATLSNGIDQIERSY
jgi:hypothetical protein